jgi:hypothetical protein
VGLHSIPFSGTSSRCLPMSDRDRALKSRGIPWATTVIRPRRGETVAGNGCRPPRSRQDAYPRPSEPAQNPPACTDIAGAIPTLSSSAPPAAPTTSAAPRTTPTGAASCTAPPPRQRAEHGATTVAQPGPHPQPHTAGLPWTSDVPPNIRGEGSLEASSRSSIAAPSTRHCRHSSGQLHLSSKAFTRGCSASRETAELM